MLEYLAMMNVDVASRYTTMMTNLRSGSNSFFDSYRELVQDFAHMVLEGEGVPVDKKADLSKVLGSAELRAILVDKLNMDECHLNKIRDYVIKINKHVHKKEKMINFEDVNNYIVALYNFTAPYAISRGVKAKMPSMNDIHDAYAEYERQRNYNDAVIRTMEQNGESINETKPRTNSRCDITSSSIFFGTTYSRYVRLRLIYIGLFVLFIVYNICLIAVHSADFSLAYALVPYQIFTLIHFINFLKLDYDSDAYSIGKYSMYTTITSGNLSCLGLQKIRHLVMLINMIFFSLAFFYGAEEFVIPEVASARWMYIPLIIIGVLIYGYGIFYYNHYKGKHVVLEDEHSERKHVYMLENDKYTQDEFIVLFKNK